MPKEKEYVPVVEPKSTSYLEYKELGRIVTPCPVFKKDTIRVRVLQICRGNPAETFETEKYWEYDIPWSEKKEEEKVITIKKEKINFKAPINNIFSPKSTRGCESVSYTHLTLPTILLV